MFFVANLCCLNVMLLLFKRCRDYSLLHAKFVSADIVYVLMHIL